MLDEIQLKNLITIVSTHPTKEGVGSQEGQLKIQLINDLQKELNNLLTKNTKENNVTK